MLPTSNPDFSLSIHQSKTPIRSLCPILWITASSLHTLQFCWNACDDTYFFSFRVCTAVCHPNRQNSERCRRTNWIFAQWGVYISSAGNERRGRFQSSISLIFFVFKRIYSHLSFGCTSSTQSAGGAVVWLCTVVLLASVLLVSTIEKINGSLENMSLVLMSIAFNILQSDLLEKNQINYLHANK